MISSMTAFARINEEICIANSAYSLEMRSLNQRFLEINFRLPENLRFLESEMRNRCRAKLHRGKIDITITQRISNGFANSLNTQALKDWLDVFAQADSEKILGNPDWQSVISLPGVLTQESQNNEMLEEALLQALDVVLSELIAMRRREGEKITEILQEKIKEMEIILANIEVQIPQIEKKIAENMRSRLNSFSVEIDHNRFEQEIVYLLSKADIREELDRLAFHIRETRETMKQDNAIGRRLDFLMQEFNREANTLGAKAADNNLSKLVVDLKVIIEQIREQVQNIE